MSCAKCTERFFGVEAGVDEGRSRREGLCLRLGLRIGRLSHRGPRRCFGPMSEPMSGLRSIQARPRGPSPIPSVRATGVCRYPTIKFK